MTEQISRYTPTDEQLVAFLDDEVNAEERSRIEAAIGRDERLAERVEWLMHSDLPFQAAYGELLEQAPQARLQAMLEALPTHKAGMPMSRRGFLAVAASFMLMGVAADRAFQAWRAPAPTSETNWRGLVADYMVLYTAQTLDNLPGDEANHRAQLRSVEQHLGLALDPEQIQLPVAQLKRAQMLEYEQTPIAQINYLDPRHGPLALCITHSRTGTRALAQEVRHGMNVVFWSGPSYAYMLIGHNTVAELNDMADLLRQRFAG